MTQSRLLGGTARHEEVPVVGVDGGDRQVAAAVVVGGSTATWYVSFSGMRRARLVRQRSDRRRAVAARDLAVRVRRERCCSTPSSADFTQRTAGTARATATVATRHEERPRRRGSRPAGHSSHQESRCTLNGLHDRPEERLPSPRLARWRESRSRSSSASSTAGSPPSRKRAWSSSSAARIPSTSSGATTTPAPVSRMSVGRRAVRRHDREDRPAGGEVLEDLPGEDALAPAARVGHEQEQGLGVALEPKRLRARRYGISSSRSPSPSDSRPLAVGSSGSRRRSARRRRHPSRASACRNGRGSRFPKKLPACVIRKRGAGSYSSPAKSSKSQPLAIVRTAPRGSSPRTSSAIASETHEIASASPRDEAREPARSPPAARASPPCPRAGAGWRRADRGDPRASGRRSRAGPPRRRSGPSPGGEVVMTASIPSRRAIRIAAGIAVRFHVTLASGTSSRRAVTCACTSARSSPSAARELLRRLPRARADVAHAVHPRLGRDAQLGIAVHPLRVVGREHVGLDPERGQVLRELERALHAAAARGREVHRHEQHLHRREA